MNKCGDCNICCTVMNIENVSKSGDECKHICEEGCSIYSKRPNACSHFKCAYLTSGWDEEFRPDKSGIMIVGYVDQISAYRTKEEINIDLFEIIQKKSSENNIRLIGYDCRDLRSKK